MGLTEILAIILLAGSLSVVGVAWVGSLLAYAAIQYLPAVPPPSSSGQLPVAWTMAASALMVWLLGATARPQ